MLGFDSLTPEQKKQLAKLSPELAKELEEEERLREEELASIMTPEKYRARVEAIKKEYLAKYHLG